MSDDTLRFMGTIFNLPDFVMYCTYILAVDCSLANLLEWKLKCPRGWHCYSATCGTGVAYHFLMLS